MRIGLVDLDTSHPASWLPHERELGHEVVGVWDGGGVHPAGYAEQFATEHGIPRVFPSPEAMIGEIDLAIIHSANWDRHVERARPFVEAGVSVLIDKPLAGNLRDLRQFVQWAEYGARIAGGSSLRFCVEAQEWNARPVEERGTPHTALCGCGVDEFSYGIHAYSLIFGLLGTGVQSVRHLGEHGQRRIQITFDDGRLGFLTVGPTDWMPFHGTVITEKGVAQFTADSNRLYRALLETVLPYLGGETDTPPIPMPGLIQPELSALAARQSWLNGDREVNIADIAEDTAYDGFAFEKEYRKARYPAH
ncbi:MAG: Gfo/Idh/MocA family oxidoreductase [Armatimonadota bacterium]